MFVFVFVVYCISICIVCRVVFGSSCLFAIVLKRVVSDGLSFSARERIVHVVRVSREDGGHPTHSEDQDGTIDVAWREKTWKQRKETRSTCDTNHSGKEAWILQWTDALEHSTTFHTLWWW